MTEQLGELESLYEAHHRQAIGLAYRLLGDMGDAEDVVQDAFLAVWRSLDRYDPARGTPRTWLMSIVRNRALDVLRTRRVHPVKPLDDNAAFADGTDVVRLVEARLDSTRARAALTTLPDEQRQTIEMAYLVGLSHSQIASRTDEPLGTIKGRIRLGLQRLRVVLDASPAVAVAHAG
jgi:RNA polymerase sigma-70 factor, ECF subfamily